MDTRSKQVLHQYTLDALSILEHSVQLVKEGEISFYRVAAMQMRILLCDTTFRHERHEDISILPILYPDLRFHPLDADGHIDFQAEPLEITAWLELPAFPSADLTILQMIRRICDIDGGAHVEIKPQAGIPAGVNACQWIVEIAEGIIPVLSQRMRQPV